MRFDNLADWLTYQESLNVKSIDLGLERVKTVYERLQLDPQRRAVITVGGTNGKGSCVAMLTAIFTQGGYAVGTYTSPHLFRYNERICLDGIPVDDKTLCEAFEKVELARGDVALTYFEFGTLAALVIFAQVCLDVVVLEVGLGGRLDAVNIVDPDVALITALDIDHVEWLGEDRESIAKEKAGIMRPGKPMVCIDPDPPLSLRMAVEQLRARSYFINQDFTCRSLSEAQWQWQFDNDEPMVFPKPALTGDFQLCNAAGVIMTLKLLSHSLAVDEHAMAEGLKRSHLAGRFQVIAGTFTQIFDVAHNAQAARSLVQNLRAMACRGKIHAVMAMLKDKAITDVAQIMQEVVDFWYLGPLAVPRAAAVGYMTEQLREGAQVDLAEIRTFNSIAEAYNSAVSHATEGDCIVIFGSFYTVAALLPMAQEISV